MLIAGQIVPLLVNTIGKPNAIFPLLESTSFAVVADNERTEKIVTFANVLVPNGDDYRLFVEFVWSRLEAKLFVKNRIQISPLHAGFLFFIPVRIRFDLPETENNEIILEEPFECNKI